MPDSTCSIPGCETPIRARGYCVSHYGRWSRYGDPLHINPRSAKINKILADGAVECTVCGERKTLSEFSRDSTRPTGHRRTCKSCCKLSFESWGSANPEKLSASYAAYRAANADKIRAYRSEYLPEWKRRNTEKLREYTYRRRALKAGTSCGPIDIGLLWENSGGVCAICSEPLGREVKWPDDGFASIDHIHPLSQGGTHTQENLQYTCLGCNLRKHAKVI